MSEGSQPSGGGRHQRLRVLLHARVVRHLLLLHLLARAGRSVVRGRRSPSGGGELAQGDAVLETLHVVLVGAPEPSLQPRFYDYIRFHLGKSDLLLENT